MKQKTWHDIRSNYFVCDGNSSVCIIKFSFSRSTLIAVIKSCNNLWFRVAAVIEAKGRGGEQSNKSLESFDKGIIGGNCHFVWWKVKATLRLINIENCWVDSCVEAFLLSMALQSLNLLCRALLELYNPLTTFRRNLWIHPYLPATKTTSNHGHKIALFVHWFGASLIKRLSRGMSWLFLFWSADSNVRCFRFFVSFARRNWFISLRTFDNNKSAFLFML